jgi:hypothetical protein
MKAALATCKDDIFPPGAANNWWIRARSSFAGMRAVLSEPTPRVKQNPALFVTLLRCGRMLKFGPGLTLRRYSKFGRVSMLAAIFTSS